MEKNMIELDGEKKSYILSDRYILNEEINILGHFFTLIDSENIYDNLIVNYSVIDKNHMVHFIDTIRRFIIDIEKYTYTLNLNYFEFKEFALQEFGVNVTSAYKNIDKLHPRVIKLLMILDGECDMPDVDIEHMKSIELDFLLFHSNGYIDNSQDYAINLYELITVSLLSRILGIEILYYKNLCRCRQLNKKMLAKILNFLLYVYIQ